MEAENLLPAPRLAVVLPRYGESLGGGAETLVRELITHAASGKRQLFTEVEVLTTCAEDHRTWENKLPAGISFDGSIKVQRFPVDSRNIGEFIRYERAMQEGRSLTPEEQLAWLNESVNSRSLYAHLLNNGARYDMVLLAPYLFATTFFAGLIHPQKSIIIPCLHDEHYAYQEVFRELFRRVRGVIFNAEPERQLFDQIYALPEMAKRGFVVGMGFDSPDPSPNTRANELTSPPSAYVLYSGRKERGKNLDLLLRYYGHYRDWCEVRRIDPLELILIGAGEIDFTQSLPRGVTDLGFVSEARKHRLMSSAKALIQPSQNESFSIVLMEAWQHGCPVVVHAGCAVTKYHVKKSGGGLYFASPEDFCGVLSRLATDEPLRVSLGEAGRKYVSTEYAWDAVLDRFEDAVKQLFAYPT